MTLLLNSHAPTSFLSQASLVYVSLGKSIFSNKPNALLTCRNVGDILFSYFSHSMKNYYNFREPLSEANERSISLAAGLKDFTVVTALLLLNKLFYYLVLL